MFWKIYTALFFVINGVSLIVFDYRFFSVFAFASLLLSCALNVAVFSFAFKKEIFPKQILVWIFKLNIGLIGLFLSFEFITFLQEAVGFALFSLPTSGLVSVIASFPSLPALYATYKMAYPKKISKSKNKSKRI